MNSTDTPPHALEQRQADRAEAPLVPQSGLDGPHPATLDGKTPAVALFNLAIESKLRACDLVRLLGESQYQAAWGRVDRPRSPG